MNAVSIYPVEMNISIPVYFDVPFQNVLEFLKKNNKKIFIFSYTT